MANNAVALSSSTLRHLTTKPTSLTSGLGLRIRAKVSTAMAASAAKTKVVPAVIVGEGRVGRALEGMGNGGENTALRCLALIAELALAAAAEKGLVFEEAMEDRLCAYSCAVAHFPTAVKEFKWRNGWFYSLS